AALGAGQPTPGVALSYPTTKLATHCAWRSNGHAAPGAALELFSCINSQGKSQQVT
ncbi:hypothetical protein A2U01_0037054, partial [Trifolium medium]|nr:hypothetical protein [Trifolium medium]